MRLRVLRGGSGLGIDIFESKVLGSLVGRVGETTDITGQIDKLKEKGVKYIIARVGCGGRELLGGLDFVYVCSMCMYSSSIGAMKRYNSVVSRAKTCIVDASALEECLGVLSRTKFIDHIQLSPFFGIVESRRRKEEWLGNAFRGRADRVFAVFDVQTNRIAGFLTSIRDRHNIHIDLLVIEDDKQGLGYGRLLLEAFLSYYMTDTSIENVHVGTRETNLLSCKLYESCGFTLQRKEYIYHMRIDGN